MDFPTLTTYLRNVIHKRPYMPQFLGNDMEAAALAAYLAGDLHGSEVDLAELVTPTDQGQQIYNDNCIGCHDIDIVETWAEKLSLTEIITGLESLSSLNEMMPDFTGTAEEKLLLAGYLHSAAAPAVIDGATVYEQNCTGCHGKETLLDWAASKSKTDITGGLANLASLNAMMAGLSLDEQERAAIADWILTEQRGGR
jgi:mono/diheme cytochrome c family protein